MPLQLRRGGCLCVKVVKEDPLDLDKQGIDIRPEAIHRRLGIATQIGAGFRGIDYRLAGLNNIPQLGTQAGQFRAERLSKVLPQILGQPGRSRFGPQQVGAGLV
jgi:hypothetical protein